MPRCGGLASEAPASLHPQTQRQLRALTRSRPPLLEERARLVNRLQAVLEDAHSKLAWVGSDVRGVSARAILEALGAGESDAQVVADLARGRLRRKGALLAQTGVGRMMAPQAFMRTEPVSHLERLEEAIERLGREIAQGVQEEHAVLDVLESIPGVSRKAAEILVAEIGSTLQRFPAANHLAFWARDLPGQRGECRQALEWQDPHGQSLAPSGLDRNCACRLQNHRDLPGGPVPQDSRSAWQETRAGGAGASDAGQHLPEPHQAGPLSRGRRHVFR